LAYLVLCIDMGRLLPGVPSFPMRIAQSDQEYVAALRIADAGELAGNESLHAMTILVCDAAIAVLDAAVAAATPI